MKRGSKKIQYAEVQLSGQEAQLFGTSNQVYQLASNSKAFTALGILALRQRGKLELDAPTDAYAEELRFRDKHGARQPVTIRQLLNHCGGIGGNTIRFQREGKLPLADTARAIADMPLRTVPGVEFRYATGGYVVLGRIIETVSDQSYGDFMRENIFTPLGLDMTSVEQTPLRGLKDGLFGVRYANWKGCPGFAPAGYLVSTPGNCTRWLGLLVETVKADDEYKTLLRSSQDLQCYVQTGRRGVLYGFGWYYDEERHLYFHDGRNPYFSSCIAFSPTGRAGAVLCNIHSSLPEQRVFQFMTGNRQEKSSPNFCPIAARIGLCLLFLGCVLVVHATGIGAIILGLIATLAMQWVIYLISGGLSVRQQYLWLSEWLFVLFWTLPAGIVILAAGLFNLFFS